MVRVVHGDGVVDWHELVVDEQVGLVVLGKKPLRWIGKLRVAGICPWKARCEIAG